MKRKAVALISGGLDSMLSARLVLDQGVPVTALRFETPFDCGGGGAPPQVRPWESLGLEVRCIRFGEGFLDMVKAPRHGRGKNMNPCIDCKIMMLTRAKAVLEEQEGCCVVTGEVLGQRPMSQGRRQFALMEKETGLKRMILRPLTAKLLDPTRAEEEGLVDRERLLDIGGRGRTRQYELAERFGIEDIPQPAGGCLLTEAGFAAKLAELWERDPGAGLDEVALLRAGRHFRTPGGSRIVVGRNEGDNERIVALARAADAVLRLRDHIGPVTLVRGACTDADLRLAAALTARYGDAPGGEPVPVGVELGGASDTITVSAIGDAEIEPLRVGSSSGGAPKRYRDRR
ncbi:MAG: tRNA 4-thiouridine(8) synthase ThiI [Planctomycetota bacterium]|jgi:tRNA U34 2-thiouridine synthase MnmA/TrmU